MCTLEMMEMAGLTLSLQEVALSRAGPASRPLLTLEGIPAEIRNQIYSEVAVQDQPILVFPTYRKEHPSHQERKTNGIEDRKRWKPILHDSQPELAAVSRQVRREVLSLFYSDNAFVFYEGRRMGMDEQLHEWVIMIGEENLARIRRIGIHQAHPERSHFGPWGYQSSITIARGPTDQHWEGLMRFEVWEDGEKKCFCGPPTDAPRYRWPIFSSCVVDDRACSSTEIDVRRVLNTSRLITSLRHDGGLGALTSANAMVCRFRSFPRPTCSNLACGLEKPDRWSPSCNDPPGMEGW